MECVVRLDLQCGCSIVAFSLKLLGFRKRQTSFYVAPLPSSLQFLPQCYLYPSLSANVLALSITLSIRIFYIDTVDPDVDSCNGIQGDPLLRPQQYEPRCPMLFLTSYLLIGEVQQIADNKYRQAQRTSACALLQFDLDGHLRDKGFCNGTMELEHE